MPSPVNSASPASAIAALLRQAMAGQAQPSRSRAGSASSSSKAERGGKSAKGASGAKFNPPLADLVAARAEGLNPDASDYRSRLLRLVIEVSLLHEFGHNLLNAPKFQSMVDQVLHELESSPQLKQDVDTVLSGLTQPQTFTR